MDNAYLTASGLYKSFGELDVLKGIDLTIKQGEVLSIVGASGAGKSTLLHILGTLDTPDKGSLMISGTEVSQLPLNELAAFRNKHIGFVFQFHNLLAEFNALENVCMPALIAGDEMKSIEPKAKELLHLLGVDKRAKHKPNEMSGGEQQRVAVARALINDPALVFADEPSGNLDSKSAEELHNLFFTLRESLNQTFVIVTHNLELAAMADRKEEIKDGRILLKS